MFVVWNQSDLHSNMIQDQAELQRCRDVELQGYRAEWFKADRTTGLQSSVVSIQTELQIHLLIINIAASHTAR